MLAALLFLIALVLTALAWRAGRSADASRVPGSLLRLGIASAVETIVFPYATHASGAAAIALTIVVGIAAIVAFDGLVRIALWAPIRPIPFWVRAPFALAAIVATLTHGPVTAISFALLSALLSYRWRDALGTIGLFRAFLGAVVLTVLFLVPLPKAGTTRGLPLAELLRFAEIAIGAVRLYVVIGLFKTFGAFTKDPTLGIRTVSRRLALSHVLVLAVPLAITLVLWVSTTYLGVNADKALAGRRLLERESADIAAELAATGAEEHPDAAVLRLATERRRQWPGTRLWIDRGHGLVRVMGDSIPGERYLDSLAAGVDTLRSHGVVGLRGRRWLGAVAHVGRDSDAVVLLAPMREALDSTLTPVLRAQFMMNEGQGRGGAAVNDSIQMTEEDSLSALGRDIAAIGSRRNDRNERATNGPRFQFSGKRRQTAVTVGTSTARDTTAAIAFSGMAIVSGPEYIRRRWQRSEFMLIARADLGTTLVGLYSNLRENPLQSVPVVMLSLIFLLLLPVAIVDISMVRGMGSSIARAIGALRDGAAALGKGELQHRIAIEGNDDLWETARQFNRMAEGLERARVLELERDRLETELELARRIQQRLLPEGPPHVPGLDIAGCSEAAREVGGDYYDHFDLGGGRVLLVIADVSGKGVPAALLMSAFRASLMSQDTQLGPEHLAERINGFLHRSVETGKFVTAFLGFLDASSGRLVYANAGHNPPALLRKDGRVDWLAAGGVVLGIMPHFRFESGEALLERGDLLTLYTDGVTEGQNSAGELWGDDRLVASLRLVAGKPCGEAAQALVREVRAFEGEAGAADDITVLMARRV